MMSNCGSVYSISADGGVCVERGATLHVCPCICVSPMYDSGVPLQKRLVGRLASSIVKIFPFPLSQPSRQPYHALARVRPSCFLSFHLPLFLFLSLSFLLSLSLSLSLKTSRASGAESVWVMSRMVGLGLRWPTVGVGDVLVGVSWYI